MKYFGSLRPQTFGTPGKLRNGTLGNFHFLAPDLGSRLPVEWLARKGRLILGKRTLVPQVPWARGKPSWLVQVYLRGLPREPLAHWGLPFWRRGIPLIYPGGFQNNGRNLTKPLDFKLLLSVGIPRKPFSRGYSLSSLVAG